MELEEHVVVIDRQPPIHTYALTCTCTYMHNYKEVHDLYSMLVQAGSTVHRDRGFPQHALLDCDTLPPCAPLPALGRVRVNNNV